MAEDGRSPAEITERLERLQEKVHTSFIVDDLSFMARAGQVNQQVCDLTRSLLLRPVLRMKKGKVVIGGFCIGSRERAWRRYISGVFRQPLRYDPHILLVTYAGLTKRDMDWIRAEIGEYASFETVYFRKASPAIAVNCGPGTFGLMMMEK
jgi:fatty acid-binding protein DegV